MKPLESYGRTPYNLARVRELVSALSFPSVGDIAAEFSWTPCWACRSPLGGERHELRHVDEGETFTEMVCADCAAYLANGTLPEGGDE